MTRTRTLPEDLTDAEVKDLLQGQAGKKPSKYRAVKTTVDGQLFDSKAEAAWFMGLRAREKAQEIRELRRQVKYPLYAGDAHICDYVADATYEEWRGDGWHIVTADLKGVRTPAFNLKAKLFWANYGRQIQLVDAKGKKTLVPKLPKPKAPPTPRTVKKERK